MQRKDAEQFRHYLRTNNDLREAAVRVQLENGLIVPVNGAEEVREFMEALEEHLESEGV